MGIGAASGVILIIAIILCAFKCQGDPDPPRVKRERIVVKKKDPVLRSPPVPQAPVEEDEKEVVPIVRKRSAALAFADRYEKEKSKRGWAKLHDHVFLNKP